MARPLFFLVLLFLWTPVSTHRRSNEQGFTSVVLSNKGTDFAKGILIKKAVSSMIPLQLPDIEKSKKIPLLGKVNIVLSDIMINSVSIGSSSVETGDMGIVLVASGATADLTMNWMYSYKKWVVVLSDSGRASVQVKDMEVGLTVTLKEEDGTLKLSLLNCGCNVKDISIKLDGGASWLYQAVVDAFERPIASAVENAISKKIREGISKLDSRLHSLPKRFSIDHVSAMNVAFVDDPVLSNSSIEFDINGLFMALDNVLIPNYYYGGIQADSSNCPAKMIEISLHENVFNTAAAVYFNAGYMHWVVDRFPNQSFLNTATWRFIYPQLYKQYPNDDMTLNMSLTSPPVIKIVENDIDATIYLDVTVNVLDANKVIPVACVSLVVRSSCFPHMLRNKLAGVLKLKDFTMSYKWSSIGDLHMHLLRPVAFAVLETIFIPYMNIRLMKGLSLPLLHGFTLRDTEIHCKASKMTICSNLAVTYGYLLNQQSHPLQLDVQ
ncbi:putative BPI/LBP family protein At1g04970 isoform X2 [Ricinus communis]|uniref:Lipopolysaccharide-binding protein, putative n=1 Tax=Ricinus communis TaxID=3988 RepID=B9SYY7_RICCO|nr:putative BPI/LBP family protein At1g04970 isoform X2 [Ricinus communis]EEF31183.1 Lipopolysaccharide-binding protein precursor, putative [Ricinus communis]|eukprot:XP_002531206.1 putative BPI/LBP family protein At1g04970 isoform X2 [Ricinus communis]